jgi:hypothetical protein
MMDGGQRVRSERNAIRYRIDRPCVGNHSHTVTCTEWIAFLAPVMGCIAPVVSVAREDTIAGDEYLGRQLTSNRLQPRSVPFDSRARDQLLPSMLTSTAAIALWPHAQPQISVSTPAANVASGAG